MPDQGHCTIRHIVSYCSLTLAFTCVQNSYQDKSAFAFYKKKTSTTQYVIYLQCGNLTYRNITSNHVLPQ